MEIPTKKLKNGFEMPILGLGTWLMGGTKVRDPENNDAAQIVSIKNAIKQGVTHIDTAENYAEGAAEEIVGEAIKDFERRDLFITSKIDKLHLRHDDFIASAKQSLKRLQLKYLDLYLIHAPSVEIALEEYIPTFDELVDEGLVRNIGVSNFSTERLKRAQSLTKNKIVVNQVYYNLLNREPEHEGLLEYCQNNDIFLEAYRPLEQGRILIDTPEILTEMAKRYDKTPAQIALNWLISQKNVVTISKMAQLQHLEDSLGAVGWELSVHDIELLRSKFPGKVSKPETFPLQ